MNNFSRHLKWRKSLFPVSFNVPARFIPEKLSKRFQTSLSLANQWTRALENIILTEFCLRRKFFSLRVNLRHLLRSLNRFCVHSSGLCSSKPRKTTVTDGHENWCLSVWCILINRKWLSEIRKEIEKKEIDKIEKNWRKNKMQKPQETNADTGQLWESSELL